MKLLMEIPATLNAEILFYCSFDSSCEVDVRGRRHLANNSPLIMSREGLSCSQNRLYTPKPKLAVVPKWATGDDRSLG